jgi:hypothetical protein
MEFLLVEFDEERKVIIDDVEGDWLTNQTLNIEAGPHWVTLAPPSNFTPQDGIPINLHHTTVLDPKRITFVRIPL